MQKWSKKGALPIALNIQNLGDNTNIGMFIMEPKLTQSKVTKLNITKPSLPI